jgi:Asp-tRNA(Asn)/Glu-tRNA(Gln) amidotransferase A subunit family amidase
MTDLCALDAADLIRCMREGISTAREVMQAHVDRIEAAEPTLRAWAYLDLPTALSAAAAADEQRHSGAAPGPLHGVPVGVKDIIDTADMPTTFGTRVHAGRQPTADATIVARLRGAGAIVVGKTVTSEYALYNPSPTRNPHGPARSTGESSSGSAAAVAAKMVLAALATQTNGSTVRPARSAASSDINRASACYLAPAFSGR